MDRSEPRAEAFYGAGDLPGVERVVDPPVRRQPAPQLRRYTVLWFAGNHGQVDAGQPRCGFDEPRCRVEQIGRDKCSNQPAGKYPLWQVPVWRLQERPSSPLGLTCKA
jgi:hypothetical protein